LDSNKYLFTDRGTSSAGADKTAFSKALAQAQALNGVNPSSSQSLNAVSPDGLAVSVKPGDTLSNIVRGYFASQGQNISSSDALRLSQDLARSNGIQNPDKIYPGQQINLSALSSTSPTGATPDSLNALSAKTAILTAQAYQTNAARPAQWTNATHNVQTQASQGTSRVQSGSGLDSGENPILNKTLDRAVEKGFIPAQERAAVYEKIVSMSKTYQFHPDDFARLTLMESDGMNPKATNNRCHGIIQFCDGPDRGAASAGFATNAKEITNRSVLQQLDLVSKYFDETGLKNFGPANLDDLYLTVLTPAARSETRAHANLNIAGAQASMLHVNRDTSAPITRHSIIEGLHQNAINRLGLDMSATSVAQNTASNTNSTLNARNNVSNPSVNVSANINTNINTNSASSRQALQLMQATLMAQTNQMNQGQGLGQAVGQGQVGLQNQLSGTSGLSGLGGLNGLGNASIQTRSSLAQLQQAQYNPSGPNPLVSPIAAQLAQVTQLAQAPQANQANSSAPSAQLSQNQVNTPNAPTNRAQALRVSAYLNQTYLP
jgi:hypothetical protein